LELAYARTEAEFVRGAAMAGDRSGCTALSLILDSKQRRITVANLGDCRALISRNGQAKEITRDHIPTDSAEADRICSEGGTIIADRVAGKLSVSRTIGDLDKKGQKIKGLSASPELFEIELGDDLDFVLIGCDGLFEQNTSEKLARFVRCLIRVRRCPQKVVEIEGDGQPDDDSDSADGEGRGDGGEQVYAGIVVWRAEESEEGAEIFKGVADCQVDVD
ncbi:hypothetical protein MHBO_004324, partial [Bonamia ostreae]